MFKAENIVKSYAAHTALDDVSIEVPKQSVYGLLGPNGAGKTSLIRIINQITAPDSGAVYLNGERLRREHISQIGYLPEERGLYKKMKVGEQALYLAQLKGMDKKEAKEALNHWFKKFDILAWWDKKVEELSKGMAQKIQFITTVMHRPQLLILDEPFSGFDPINTNLVKSEILKLRDQGTTIILSTHNMGSVEEICDHITLINKSKKVLDGKLTDVKAKFSDEEYLIEFKGNVVSFANAVWGGWELVNREQLGEHHFLATIKLMEGNTLNNYLKSILEHVEVLGVNKRIPSMNEIFIKAVAQKDNVSAEEVEQSLNQENTQDNE
ncbi:ABC transporter ATP-binding protein [Parvicella tangerina]|uniref:ABC transporter ATP-binding protein n=1 Tax=Parvicella tangerina TaxID=2829795 RepID=UPI00215CC571|nr:ATP-binding cassette domain-containing protein [Parvicella tangerina]